MKNPVKYLKIGIILSLLLMFYSCYNDEVKTFPNTRSLQNVIDEFAELEFHEGINDIEMEGSYSNTVWRFRVIVPPGASEANRRPLVMCLHGAASLVDPELHTNTECLVEPGLAELQPILLCPNSEGFIWYELPEQEKILTLTSLVTQHLPVDPNKVAIMGYSDGANGAWYYAQYYPEAYSAAIAISGIYNPDRPAISPNIEIPMYVIHGQNDQLFPLEVTEDYVNYALDAGSDITFVVAPGLEHYNNCSYVPYLMDAGAWLENYVWQ